MRREGEIEDIFVSQSTSDVLFALIAGKKSPIQISSMIGDTSPAVIKQLWKLRKAGIVKLGKKKGKYQNYEVIWAQLVKNFVDKMTNLSTAIVLANMKGNIGKFELLERLKSRLPGNKYFKNLVKAFLEEEAKRRETVDIYLITTETVQDAINKFERFLPRFCPFLKEGDQTKERKEFLSSLQILCRAIEEANEFEAIPLKNALKRGGWIK